MTFLETLNQYQINLSREVTTTLQVNIGKRCNQACTHCHVGANPTRTENMDGKTIDRLIELLQNDHSIKTVDITGGAPELNPNFRHFVSAVRDKKIAVIDRCNLTILLEPGQEDTIEFLAKHQVEIVASLPCYLEVNVDKQRGKGVFNKSIQALKLLNQIGYGKPDTGLIINLVYNINGPYLPPSQQELQNDYKKYLNEKYDIYFNQLFTITNMPINRFKEYLQRERQLDSYIQLLRENFNPEISHNVMCKSLISVGYNGEIYDCDFNQMLEMPIGNKPTTIWDIDSFSDCPQAIAIDEHCFGCTAGEGSSCSGALN